MRGNFFTILSGFYITMLLIVFFSKKRLNSLENKIYTLLIVTNFFGVILAIMCYFCILSLDVLGLFNVIISKAYVLYVLTWVSIFSVYVFTVTYNSKNMSKKEWQLSRRDFILIHLLYILSLLF